MLRLPLPQVELHLIFPLGLASARSQVVSHLLTRQSSAFQQQYFALRVMKRQSFAFMVTRLLLLAVSLIVSSIVSSEHLLQLFFVFPSPEMSSAY